MSSRLPDVTVYLKPSFLLSSPLLVLVFFLLYSALIFSISDSKGDLGFCFVLFSNDLIVSILSSSD